MELMVDKLDSKNFRLETPGQEAYQTIDCPICGQKDKLHALAIVTSHDKTSLESVFCMRCQHRFHRKFPSNEWLQHYYQDIFESSKTSSAKLRWRLRMAAWARRTVARLPGGAGLMNMFRYGSFHRTDRVNDFALGVTKESVEGFYQKDPTIRKILEVGCGYGSSLLTFKENGYDVYGTEANRPRVDHCRSKGLKVTLCDIDNFKAIEPHAPFDLVYSKHVLEHIVDADAHIRMLSRLTREGGFIYVETPDLSGENFITQSQTTYHVHTFSLRSMLTLLAKHGFHAVRSSVDNTIQVLARKDPSLPALPDWISTETKPYPDTRAPYMQSLQKHAAGTFRIWWDQYWIKIRPADNGSVVYDRALGPFSVAHNPESVELTVHRPKDQASPSLFPVEFHYPHLPNPPLWFKTGS